MSHGFGPDDLLALLDGFTIDLHTVEPRMDPPPGNRHVADVAVRATRREGYPS